MKKMDAHIKASNEVGRRVLRKINGKRPVFMKDAGKQQNAKRQKKMELFYMILFFTLILLTLHRVIGPIVFAVWNIF